MKIRKGFVSNSSSSSFIVAFPKDMELTDTAIHNYLYGPNNRTMAYYDHEVTTQTAARIIHEEMKQQKPNDEEALLEALGGWLQGAPDYNDFHIPGQEKWDCDWDAYNAASDAYRVQFLVKFKEKVGDNFDLYAFEFSDNDGTVGCAMEHGETFDNVEHIKVSNH